MAGRSRQHLSPDKRDMPLYAGGHVSHNDAVANGEPRDTTNSAHAFGHRGYPVASVVNGKTVRAGGAVNLQARHGAPRKVSTVGVHAGMVSTTRHDGVLRTGGGDMSSALESGSVIGPGIGSLLPAGPRSPYPDAKPVPGMRSRVGEQHAAPGVNHAKGVAEGGRLNLDLGRAILAAAVEGKRRIPQTVKEK